MNSRQKWYSQERIKLGIYLFIIFYLIYKKRFKFHSLNVVPQNWICSFTADSNDSRQNVITSKV